MAERLLTRVPTRTIRVAPGRWAGRHRAIGTVLLLLGAAVSVALALPAGAQTTGVTKPAATGASSAQARDVDLLHPGDVVRLRIWREPDLTGEFPIDETGTVVLPKLGPVDVSRDTPAALRARLVAEYSKFLNHNSIDVTLLRRVQVLGAVREPGVYPVDPTMTISDVLALAGGTTAEGNPDKLELIRAGKRIPGSITRQSLVSESPVRSGDQIFVPERSWVRRNAGFLFATVIGAAVSVVVTVFTR